MDILLDSIEKTGLLTTVGGPSALAIAAFKLLRKDAHYLYYLLPFLQVFLLILGYMAIFGWRIETSPILTIILFSFGSIIASIFTTFLMRQYVPSHLYLDQIAKFPDINGESLPRVIFVWLFFWAAGVIALILTIYGQECTNPRCAGHEFIWGSNEYVGSVWLPTFLMCGINTLVLFAVFVAKRRRI